MSYTLIVRPLAEGDLEQAYQWYEGQSEGLGAEFIRAVDAVFAALERQPEQYPVTHGQIRRALLRRFPYAVYYVIREDRRLVQVIACLHQRQNPRRWQLRQ